MKCVPAEKHWRAVTDKSYVHLPPPHQWHPSPKFSHQNRMNITEMNFLAKKKKSKSFLFDLKTWIISMELFYVSKMPPVM